MKSSRHASREHKVSTKPPLTILAVLAWPVQIPGFHCRRNPLAGVRHLVSPSLDIQLSALLLTPTIPNFSDLLILYALLEILRWIIWTYGRVQISCEACLPLSLSRTRERLVPWPSLSSGFSLEIGLVTAAHLLAKGYRICPLLGCYLLGFTS